MTERRHTDTDPNQSASEHYEPADGAKREPSEEQPEEFRRFDKLLGKLVRVPKSEVDERRER